MDHEFSELQHLAVGREGFRIDKEGIKKHCNLSELKSVDYFEDHTEKGFLLIEFSDLFKQDDRVQSDIESLNACNLDKRQKKQLKKQYYREIHQELVKKFKDSRLIATDLPNHFINIPTSFANEAQFVIVLPSFEIQGKRTKAEIARFVDILKDKVISSLPRHYFSSVSVIPLDIFCK